MDLDALGIPHAVLPRIQPVAKPKARLAAARGLLPLGPKEQLAVLYYLAADEDVEMASVARDTLREMPLRQVLQGIHIRINTKILEALIEFRDEDPELDERVGMLRTTNDRTARIIARRASSALCEKLSRNHERLLMTPDIYVDLHANENCTELSLERAQSFLRMQRCLPEVPEVRPFLLDAEPSKKSSAARPSAKREIAKVINIEEEIRAAMSGRQSPVLLKAQEGGLEMFDLADLNEEGGDEALLGSFDFALEDDIATYGWELTVEKEDRGDEDAERVSVEKQLRDMSVGKRIKLAYRGNKEVRKILVRDSNKIVASAVVRSGRLTDAEVSSFAGNRNLERDVIREIAANGEYLRKYPVKVALVNNPKTPVPVAVGLVKGLQKKDLMMLTRNRNVPSVISQAATRLFREKYRKS